MKHSILGKIGVSILTTVVAGLTANQAFSNDSGSVTVQGTVPAINEITVTSQAGYNSLDLATGATNQTVAVVLEKNNDPDGYTVTVVSANALAAGSSQARLNGADSENATVINYSMQYGTSGSEAAVTLGAGGSAIVTSTSDATDEAGSSKNLQISFDASTWRKADAYSDTITLTIAAK